MTAPIFQFSSEDHCKIKQILAHYPPARKTSALIPILDVAQRANEGWLSREAMQAVADLLDIPFVKVYEVASFYTMFNLTKVGRYHLKVCGTTPCWLRGADELMKTCKQQLSLNLNETTADGLFTLSEFECLGACVNAPVIQINDDYIEDLTPELLITVLEELKAGNPLKAKSCLARTGSKATSCDSIPPLKDLIHTGEVDAEPTR